MMNLFLGLRVRHIQRGACALDTPLPFSLLFADCFCGPRPIRFRKFQGTFANLHIWYDSRHPIVHVRVVQQRLRNSFPFEKDCLACVCQTRPQCSSQKILDALCSACFFARGGKGTAWATPDAERDAVRMLKNR